MPLARIKDVLIMSANNREKCAASTEVSFIIPTFNSELYLPRCLSAIRKQQCEGADFFEIIVVDNGSTDATVRIAREYGAKIYSAPGETVAALRNLGALKSTGSLLAYVDSDCVISEGWLEYALRHFTDPETGAAGATTCIEDNSGWVPRYWLTQRRKETGIKNVSWLPTENLVIRKSVFEAAGGFNEHLITCEDVDLCYRIARNFKILSDPAMHSVHLGEARTLSQFYKKEKWRGKGNLQGLFAHGIIPDEIPSLLLPLYYLVSFLLLFFSAWGLIHGKTGLFLASALMITFPVALLAFRTSVRGKNWKAFGPLSLLYFIYSLARTAAILPWGVKKKDR